VGRHGGKGVPGKSAAAGSFIVREKKGMQEKLTGSQVHRKDNDQKLG
jgi:hypothetical protein